MRRPVAYLDTNIFSRKTDRERVSLHELQAIDRLADHFILVSSALAEKEIMNIPERYSEDRDKVMEVFKGLARKVQWTIPEYAGTVNGAPLGATAVNANWVDPLYDALEKIFDADDAAHIFQASKAECDYFVTLDGRTILGRATHNKEFLLSLLPHLQFFSPFELLKTQS